MMTRVHMPCSGAQTQKVTSAELSVMEGSSLHRVTWGSLQLLYPHHCRTGEAFSWAQWVTVFLPAFLGQQGPSTSKRGVGASTASIGSGWPVTQLPWEGWGETKATSLNNRQDCYLHRLELSLLGYENPKLPNEGISTSLGKRGLFLYLPHQELLL